MSTDRGFVVICFAFGLCAATIAWAIGLSEWQAWLSAAILATALCAVYTLRVIVPKARSHPPRSSSERAGPPDS